MKQMQILRELSVENRNFDILFKGKKNNYMRQQFLKHYVKI